MGAKTNVVEEANTSPISTKHDTDIVEKQRNHKHSKKVLTSKKINPTNLTKLINQSLLQELIYLIKVTEQKKPHK